MSPDGNKVYVANYNNPGTVRIINTATNTVTDTINVGNGPEKIFISAHVTTDNIAPKNNANASFDVYPNPASDMVTLNICNTINTDLTLKIYTVLGTLVKSETLKQNNRQINIGDLNNGVYIITIKTKDWSESQRLIIQR